MSLYLDQHATTVATCIFEDYGRHYGLPESINTEPLLSISGFFFGINKTIPHRTRPSNQTLKGHL